MLCFFFRTLRKDQCEVIMFHDVMGPASDLMLVAEQNSCYNYPICFEHIGNLTKLSLKMYS